jgi:carbonic anhydrase
VLVGGFAGRASAQSEQTPIDLDHTIVTRTALSKIQFNYPKDMALQVVNTGSPGEFATVRAIPPTGAATVTVDGVEYKLLQFHWHAASEHEVNGHKYPMEMHLVHQAADNSLLVIGVFIKQSGTQKELKKIFSQLPQNDTDSKTVASFDFRKILPSGKASFRYAGSLTTPPFTEGVKWIVLDSPIQLSRKQIAAFEELFPDGNSREVQPLNDRTVNTDVKRRKFYKGGF